MKIAIIYFEKELPNNRKHHSVNLNLLKNWLKFYEKSKTICKPTLILDKSTKVPYFWNYDYIVCENSEPPKYLDVLNKVGWMKAQSFDLLGKCLVMDIDALILESIDELEEITEPIAMSPDSGTEKNWHWAKDWKSAEKKYNAGVLYLNSNEIWQNFQNLWKEKEKYLNITYFDEIIFSSLLNTMKGKILNKIYNTEPENLNKNTKIIHFSGNRKEDLINFSKKHDKSIFWV